MTNTDLWKHITKEKHSEFLHSLLLFGKTEWSSEKQLRTLYAIAANTHKHYKRAKIKKSDGTNRELLMPDYILKKIQRNILKNALEKLSVSSHVTAYRKGDSVLKNAAVHLGKSKILKLDIKNFFDSITFSVIYRYAFPRVYYPPSVAGLLTALCCYDSYLPQGAPTSAAISNLVMKNFDNYIGKWCSERKIAYTRYCDDMTFSGDFNAAPLKTKVSSMLFAMGFELNDRKTKVIKRSGRQLVTGVVVNDKLQVSKNYRRKIRQEVYYIEKYGLDSHLSKINSPKEKYLCSLLGRINYVLQINPSDKDFLVMKDTIINAAV